MMTSKDEKALTRAAIAAIRACADTIESQATGLLQALPSVPMEAGLRATTLKLGAALRDTAGRVTFELALLETQLAETGMDAAKVVRRLIEMDATMMDALAPVAELADGLESAAERDEKNERAFVLVIEAAGVMLQELERARAATEVLSSSG